MKHVQNFARIKYGFAKLVVILFTFNTEFDHVIPSNLIVFYMTFQSLHFFLQFAILGTIWDGHLGMLTIEGGSNILHTIHKLLL